MKVNLLILQPPGYVHSLCFLDTARYLSHYLKLHGIETQLSKNRPEAAMVNIIFGAHLGVPRGWDERYCCVWFNQEQIGAGGADLPAEYLSILANSNVIDYDPANMASYPPAAAVSPPALAWRQGGFLLREHMPLLHAPFLTPSDGGRALQDRPLDLLFFGSVNAERQALIDRIQACGVDVARFDRPLYGPERDAYIAQAKAVLNIPFYAANRFEQVRVFNALSIGTPVVSLRRPGLWVDPAYEDSVHWFDANGLERFFKTQFMSNDWFESSHHQLRRWQAHDPKDAIASLARQLRRLDEIRVQRQAAPCDAPPITHLNLRAHRHYYPDWFNVSPVSLPQADAVLNIEHEEPDGRALQIISRGGPVIIEPGTLKALLAEVESDSIDVIMRLLSHAATLLADDGVLVLDCPLGLFVEDPVALGLAQQRKLAKVRAALDEERARGHGIGTMELTQEQSIGEPAFNGVGTRQALRLQLTRRTCTPHEQSTRRGERLDFGWLKEFSSVDRLHNGLEVMA